MTIEARALTPARPASDDDDAPRPARRQPPPPRYAPRPAAKPPQPAPATPAPVRGAPPPPRARNRDPHARDAHGRDAPRPRGGPEAADADPQTPGVQAVAPPRDDGRSWRGDGDGDGPAAAFAGAGGAAAAGSGAAGDDAALEAGLQGLHDQRGIFELLLPGGQSVGVVVQTAAAGVHFMLSAGGGALEQRLRQNKMELERRLQLRMQKDVRIALL